MMTFRKLITALGPSWLVKDKVILPDGSEVETESRVFYPMMLMFDALTDRLQRGIRARKPGFAPEDALQYIGQGLSIFRGPAESLASYEARVTRGIDDKRVSGNAWALLEQIRGYCTPYAVRVRLVNEHGHWYTLERDGTTRVRHRYTPWNWDKASAIARMNATRKPFGRFWVLIYPTTDAPKKPWDRDGTWNDGEIWGAATTQTWGSTATPDDVTAIRRIVERWRPAGSRCVSILVVFSDTALQPTHASPPLPDGLWATDGKYETPGLKTPARSTDAIYWSGTSAGSGMN